jgi:ribosomal protein S27E
VNKGYLTVDQVQDILRDQNKTSRECEGCATRFNVIGYEEGKTIKCTKCGRRLVIPEGLESTAVQDSIEQIE